MITVVSGIPRSGTSLMMQMLSAGGIPALEDGERVPDANNPRGYYELESVKSLRTNPQIIAQAEGKVVKVVSSLLTFLPRQYEYKVIFMRRPMQEILASQERMMERLGKSAVPVAADSVANAFESHLKHIAGWLSQQQNMHVLYVEYTHVVDQPLREAERIRNFLDRELDVQKMGSRVERSLHREKSASEAASVAGNAKQGL